MATKDNTRSPVHHTIASRYAVRFQVKLIDAESPGPEVNAPMRTCLRRHTCAYQPYGFLLYTTASVKLNVSGASVDATARVLHCGVPCSSEHVTYTLEALLSHM